MLQAMFPAIADERGAAMAEAGGIPGSFVQDETAYTSTTPTPAEAYMTEAQLRNVRWWFHDFDANCDGLLDDKEQRDWLSSLGASVSVSEMSTEAAPGMH